jgi:hypothetical protein
LHIISTTDEIVVSRVQKNPELTASPNPTGGRVSKKNCPITIKIWRVLFNVSFLFF